MKRLLIAFLFITVSAGSAMAAKAVNFSLVPDVAVFNKTTRIEGFILNIWGENPQSAFALGLINGSTGNSSGVSLSVIANYADTYTGGHLAFVNWAKRKFTGFQGGAFNYAEVMTGLQIGIVNYAGRMESGLQLGLVNVIPQTKTWFNEFPSALTPFFIVANWRF